VERGEGVKSSEDLIGAYDRRIATLRNPESAPSSAEVCIGRTCKSGLAAVSDKFRRLRKWTSAAGIQTTIYTIATINVLIVNLRFLLNRHIKRQAAKRQVQAARLSMMSIVGLTTSYSAQLPRSMKHVPRADEPTPCDPARTMARPNERENTTR